MIDFQSNGRRFSIRTATCGSEEDVQTADNVPGLLAVWPLIRRRRRVILFSVLVGILSAGLYCVFAQSVFMSKTAILVIGKDPSLPEHGINSEQDPSVGDDLLATHMLIFSSPTVVSDALAKGQLDKLPSIVTSLDKDETPTDYVIDNLRVTRGGEGQGRAAHILNVRFRHNSANDGAAILRSLVKSYREFIDETFQGGIGEAAALIEQAKNELEQKLAEIETEYQTFLQSTSVIRKGEEVFNVHLDNMKTFTAALAQLRMQKTEIESRLQEVGRAYTRNGSPNSFDLKKLPLIDKQHIDRILLILKMHEGEQNSWANRSTQAQYAATSNTEHERLLELRLKLTELTGQSLGRDHPKIKRVQQSVREIKQLIAEKSAYLDRLKQSSRLDPATVASAYVGLLRSDLADLKRREKRIVARLSQEHKAAKSLVADEMTEEKLRLKKRIHQLYDTVVERLDEVNLAKDYAGFVTTVISPVELGRQTSPMPMLCLSLGALLGLCLGIALAIIFDLTQRTFFSPEDIQRSLQLPVLGHLPQFTNGDVVKPARDAKLDPTLVVHNRPASSQAEVFHSLRSSLYQNWHDSQAKVYQVTSPTPGDGKSTLAANLAISLAQAGKKVLLVDANLYRPRLADLFALQCHVGLSSVLADQVELHDVVQQTNVPNLKLVPADARRTATLEQLNRTSFAGLLDQVRDQYDYIIVDSPAVLATSDAIELAGSVDGVMLVVHVEKNSDWALKARDMLSPVTKNFLGVVVSVSSGRRSWGSRYEVGNYEYDKATYELNDKINRFHAHAEATA